MRVRFCFGNADGHLREPEGGAPRLLAALGIVAGADGLPVAPVVVG